MSRRPSRSVLPSSVGEAMTVQAVHDQGPAREALVANIRERAGAIRKDALNMVFSARQGHPGGDMSVADILATHLIRAPIEVVETLFPRFAEPTDCLALVHVLIRNWQLPIGN